MQPTPGPTYRTLESTYKSYVARINSLTPTTRHDPNLNADIFLAESVILNEQPLSKAEYHAAVDPGAQYTIVGLTIDLEKMEIGARLIKTVPGQGEMKEHCFYRFGGDGKIERVWSLVQGS